MKCESSFEHSLFLNFFGISGWVAVFSLLIALFIPQLAKAQMFSAGEERTRFNTPQSTATIGIEPMIVSYEGTNPTGVNRGLFEFEGPIIRLAYDTPRLDLFLGTGGKITGISDVSYFDVGAHINTGINLYRSQAVSIHIPIRISSRYVNMINSNTFRANFNRFRFGSLIVGGGAEILVRPQENIRIKAGAVPAYGFAFATGGSFGGSLGSVAAHSQLYFDRLFGDLGLTLGYSYDFRNYNIDEDAYDYKIKGHVFKVGITF